MRIYLLLFLFIIVGSCKPQRSATADITSSRHHPDTLRVMTYNIHHASPPSKGADTIIDLPAIAKVIIDSKADVVALQEVDRFTRRSGKGVDQAAELGRLTGMQFYYSRSMDYQDGQYGNALLSRFPIIDTMHYELPPEEGLPGEVRSVGIIKIKMPGGQEVYTGSTHLDVGRDERSRLRQSQTLLEMTSSLDAPFVLAGDFNAGPQSKTIALFDQSFTRVCSDDCPFTIPTIKPARTIDFIMFRPGGSFRAGGVEAIPETYASDHLPVVADLIINR